jgi:long-chain fatty acid transport protein
MKFTRLALGLALAGLSFGANATNGYFAHGYGMKAQGMAGAATASSDDTFGGANNPASMAFVGNRIGLGVSLFSPIRESSRTGSTGNFFDGNAESDSNFFFIPEFGYNRMLSPNLAVGVTVYGNGGMNTDYDPMPAGFGGGVCSAAPPGGFGVPAPNNILCGNGRLGVDLMQLVIAPTAAYKVNASHSIGISPLLGYQRFKAEGLNAFQGISSDRPNVTNKGYDDALGYGVRVGYLGKITPTVTIGAAYASKMNFEEFDDYAGLFADDGDFDIPSNYNLGVAWQATPQIKLALDFQRINYSDVNAVSNPSTNFFTCNGATVPNATGPGCLGEPGGAGFGWSDIDVWKLGVEYKHNNQWTFRAGWNHGETPISSRDVEFNIIAPATVEDHLALGMTYTTTSGGELTVAYMHGFENDITGPSWFFSGAPSNEDNIKMYQNSIGIAYGWKM